MHNGITLLYIGHIVDQLYFNKKLKINKNKIAIDVVWLSLKFILHRQMAGWH